MKKLLLYLVFFLASAGLTFVIFNFYQSASDKFMIKGVTFLILIAVYVLISFFTKVDYLIYSLVFLSFFTIPMTSLYTSSTNLLILTAAFICFVRSVISGRNVISFHLIRQNSATLPLIFIVVSYTISLTFVEKGWGSQFKMYQSLICATIFSLMVLGVIKEKDQIKTLNKILLSVLVLNLIFSFVLLSYPQIDQIRANFLSFSILSGEEASRSQGLSFRGEAYGEFLMICGLWLFAMLSSGQIKKGRTLLWLIFFCCVIVLILTRLRGANALLMVGILAFLLFSKSIPLPNKMVSILVVITASVLILFVLSTYTTNITLLDRFYYFADAERRIGYIPSNRYFTWVPGIRFAKQHDFMGVGPSFEPYIADVLWDDVVADNASGDVTVWPHNLSILILCTVGICGLGSYLFLLFRIIRLRKVFSRLEPYMKQWYSTWLLCFIILLIEAQKYDGILRHPSSSFYGLFLLVTLLFTCENMLLTGSEEQENSASAG